jgi:hypothetical protein
MFNSIPRKMRHLTEDQILDLCKRCNICCILGGLATCSCTSLQTYVELTGMTKQDLLKWYKKYSKKIKKTLDN